MKILIVLMCFECKQFALVKIDVPVVGNVPTTLGLLCAIVKPGQMDGCSQERRWHGRKRVRRGELHNVIHLLCRPHRLREPAAVFPGKFVKQILGESEDRIDGMKWHIYFWFDQHFARFLNEGYGGALCDLSFLLKET